MSKTAEPVLGAVLWVDPACIEEPLHEVRPCDKESDGYKFLVKTMKDEGFWPHRPLEVAPGGEPDVYVLTEGNNRIAAARELGLKTVPIVVSRAMTPAEQLLRGVIANATNIDMKPVDYARVAAKLAVLNKGWTLVKLAEKMRKTPEFIQKRLGLAKLEGKAAELVNQGSIAIESGVAIQKLQARGVKITDELLARAQREPVADFVADAKSLLTRGKEKAGPMFKLRPIGDVKDELARATRDRKTKPGYVEALKWALRQDPASEAERKKR